MAASPKPIPALYTVYVLRSTVRHASLYIGSTPHPPRRLKQHNGEVRGGAARTSRASLRPWEMVALVSGFPGMVAALKFEWALTNPHLSLHIPSESRISVSTARKRNGMPRRPRAGLASTISNLHLLLRVPSFERWPLRLHFFARDVHAAWAAWCRRADGPVRASLPVLTDFGPEDGVPGPETVLGTGSQGKPEGGVHSLPLDYVPLRGYAEKTRSIFAFEREGRCVVCKEEMAPGEGLYAVCSNDGCEGVGHLDCWSRHLIGGDGDGDAIVPVGGQCPNCEGEVSWGDMMKELTLRVRGQKEVDKLLKKKRAVNDTVQD